MPRQTNPVATIEEIPIDPSATLADLRTMLGDGLLPRRAETSAQVIGQSNSQVIRCSMVDLRTPGRSGQSQPDVGRSGWERSSDEERRVLLTRAQQDTQDRQQLTVALTLTACSRVSGFVPSKRQKDHRGDPPVVPMSTLTGAYPL